MSLFKRKVETPLAPGYSPHGVTAFCFLVADGRTPEEAVNIVDRFASRWDERLNGHVTAVDLLEIGAWLKQELRGETA